MGASVAIVNLNLEGSVNVQGTYTFDRDNGGILVVPSGSAFPVSPVAGEMFFREDTAQLYRRNAGNSAWEFATDAPVDSVNGFTGTVVLNAGHVGADPSGTAASAVSSHVSALDPHSQYTTTIEAAAAAPVQSVNTLTGAVILTASSVGADPAGTASAAVAAHAALSDPHTVYILESREGAANGIATLDGAGQVPASQLGNAAGGMSYQGTWNANTNTPTITSGVGTNGYYYRVAVAGTTLIDGINDWGVGDWIIFSGTEWQKIDNSDQVSSVFGRIGAVVAQSGDYDALQVDYDNITSGLIATNVQDAIDELAASPVIASADVVTASTTTTTTSTTAVALDFMSVTPPAGTYLITAMVTLGLSANASLGYIQIYSGGVAQGVEMNMRRGNQNIQTVVAAQAKVTVNGAQAVEIRWRVSAGTGTADGRSLSYHKVI